MKYNVYSSAPWQPQILIGVVYADSMTEAIQKAHNIRPQAGNITVKPA